MTKSKFQMSENEKLLKPELLLDIPFSIKHRTELSPKWHGEVLKKRMADTSEYVDWKQASKNFK